MLGSVALLAKDPKTALQQFQTLLKASPENLEYRLGYATSLVLSATRSKLRCSTSGCRRSPATIRSRGYSTEA